MSHFLHLVLLLHRLFPLVSFLSSSLGMSSALNFGRLKVGELAALAERLEAPKAGTKVDLARAIKEELHLSASPDPFIFIPEELAVLAKRLGLESISIHALQEWVRVQQESAPADTGTAASSSCMESGETVPAAAGAGGEAELTREEAVTSCEPRTPVQAEPCDGSDELESAAKTKLLEKMPAARVPGVLAESEVRNIAPMLDAASPECIAAEVEAPAADAVELKSPVVGSAKPEGSVPARLPFSRSRVMSWNISNFSGKNETKDFPALAETIKKVDPDLLFIQEVQNGWGGEDAIDCLVNKLLVKTNAAYKYSLSPEASINRGSSERYALLWKGAKLDWGEPEWVLWEQPADEMSTNGFLQKIGIKVDTPVFEHVRRVWKSAEDEANRLAGEEAQTAKKKKKGEMKAANWQRFDRYPGFVWIGDVLFGVIHHAREPAPKVLAEACALQALLGAAHEQGRKMVLCGDFNIDEAKQKAGMLWPYMHANIQGLTNDMALCREVYVRQTYMECIPHGFSTMLAGHSHNDNFFAPSGAFCKPDPPVSGDGPWSPDDSASKAGIASPLPSSSGGRMLRSGTKIAATSTSDHLAVWVDLIPNNDACALDSSSASHSAELSLRILRDELQRVEAELSAVQSSTSNTD